MKYYELKFDIQPKEEYIADVLAAQLAEIGFESFVNNEDAYYCYVPSDKLDETALQLVIADFPIDAKIEYSVALIEDKNWNEEWEKHYFEPIIIGNDCVIHSSFHSNVPDARYKIVIDPKMSFGTGHHETTSLIIEELLHMNLAGKSLLDMGCGTAVLAILASMLGANPIDAIDIDEWCTSNSAENIALNNTNNINIELGGAELLKNKKYDIVLANINRNILLNDMHIYSACLDKGGELYMSGFYKEDIAAIEQEANKQGLQMEYFKEKNNWVTVKMKKEI